MIVDDTPRRRPVVVRPIRREIAKITLNKLIKDGRIHPSRIEEMVNETQAEMEEHILEVGKQAVFEANWAGAREAGAAAGPAQVPHELQPERLAAQPGGGPPGRADGRRARANVGGGARRDLHDVGKAADHEMEGSSGHLEPARANGESQGVLHAIAGHHDDMTIDPNLHGAGSRRRRHQRRGARRGERRWRSM